MSDSKPGPTQAPSSDKEVNAHNSNHHHKGETHGMNPSIDETTPLDEVKAPNVFERAKEELEAIVDAIHPKKESDPSVEIKNDSKQETSDSKSDNPAESPNFIKYAKAKMEAILHHEKSPKKHHDKETHGTSDDINKSTPIDYVKAPNVFERAKEEIEAIVETIHPKKEEKNPVSPPKKKEGGFGVSVGKGLEKMCSPRCNKDGGFGASIGKGLEKMCSPRSKKD